MYVKQVLPKQEKYIVIFVGQRTIAICLFFNSLNIYGLFLVRFYGGFIFVVEDNYPRIPRKLNPNEILLVTWFMRVGYGNICGQ